MTNELSLNQATTRPYGLVETVEAASHGGIRHIGLWTDAVAGLGPARTRALIDDHGMTVTSLSRVGFVAPLEGPALQAALDEVERALHTAHEVGSPMVTFIAGGLPPHDRDLRAAAARVRDALERLVPAAEDAGVRLALEPLHPLFAGQRSVVTAARQAVELVADLPVRAIGILIDAYATWWDTNLIDALRVDPARIAGCQISDFTLPLPTAEPMFGRLLPGDGELDLRAFVAGIRDVGYTDPVEVEVFHEDVWALPLDTIIAKVVDGSAAILSDATISPERSPS